MKTQKIVVGAAFAVAVASGVAAQDSSTRSGDRSSQQGKDGMVTVTGCLMADQDGGGAAGGAATSTSRSTGADRFVLMNAMMGTGSRSGTSPAGAGATSPGAGGGTSSGAGGTTSPGAGGAASPGAGGATSQGAGSPGGAGSPAGATSASASGSTYTLEGKTSELREHVNQQVEITGKLEANASGSSSRPDSSARSGSSSTDSGSTRAGSSDRGNSQGAESSSGGVRSSASTGNRQRLAVESVRMIAASCSR